MNVINGGVRMRRNWVERGKMGWGNGNIENILVVIEENVV